MADIVQTYILKVNIGCCNACPNTLKKLLVKNKGVESFEIDEEKSRVSVRGKINLHQLIKDIKKKIKKNAELIKKESVGGKSQEQMAPPVQFSHIPGSIPPYAPHYQWMMTYVPPYAFQPPTYNH